jgi:hypothetical protein
VPAAGGGRQWRPSRGRILRLHCVPRRMTGVRLRFAQNDGC